MTEKSDMCVVDGVVGIGHNQPPQAVQDTVFSETAYQRQARALWNRPGSWNIEIAMIDILVNKRRALNKSYKRYNRPKYKRSKKRTADRVLRRTPYTAVAVASRIGVSNTNLSHWEDAYSVPDRFEKWALWAAALDLEFADLMSQAIGKCNLGTEKDYLGITIDKTRQLVMRRGESVSLTKKQMEFFIVLFLAKGKVITRERIFFQIYTSDPMRSSGEQPGIKILDILKYKVTQAIRPLGLEVGVDWGVGYFLNTAHKNYGWETDEEKLSEVAG